MECADVLEHQLEVARQRVHDSHQQVETVHAGIRCKSQKMKQDTEVTMKELEILQTEICAT